MSRLIDRDALKTVLCASKCGVIDPTRCECGCMDVLCIDDAPTIEAEPVRRGHWEHDAYIGNLYKCTACGMGMYTSENYLLEHKYCFKCGAKMDEEVRNGNT